MILDTPIQADIREVVTETALEFTSGIWKGRLLFDENDIPTVFEFGGKGCWHNKQSIDAKNELPDFLAVLIRAADALGLEVLYPIVDETDEPEFQVDDRVLIESGHNPYCGLAGKVVLVGFDDQEQPTYALEMDPGEKSPDKLIYVTEDEISLLLRPLN